LYQGVPFRGSRDPILNPRISEEIMMEGEGELYDAVNALNQMNADIIIDVNMNPLFEILCLRPAPLQISWLGRPFSTGSSDCIDYFMADTTAIEPYLQEDTRLLDGWIDPTSSPSNAPAPSPYVAPSYRAPNLRSSEELRSYSKAIAKGFSEKVC